MTTQTRSQIRPKQRGVPLPRLREWRYYKSCSQKRVAELAGISQITVSQIETGVSWASWRSIQKLADALCVDITR
jgi:transcriptional regulator with XRE-family HTH domain